MKDVASGTRSAKHSSGRKANIPNAIRTTHKAEVIRSYKPSERTLWKIFNNCSSSQRKSLAGLDNMASEGLDAFSKTICKLNGTNNTEMLVRPPTDRQGYLKGYYHIDCSSAECDGVADHCLKYALSNQVFKL